MNAEFKVIKIDPDGSGMDYDGHLGMTVTNAKRCCENCTCIFGTINDNKDFGPFIRGELEPLNDEAKQIVEVIEEFANRKYPNRTIVTTQQFNRSWERIQMQIQMHDIFGKAFDLLNFEIKKGDC